MSGSQVSRFGRFGVRVTLVGAALLGAAAFVAVSSGTSGAAATTPSAPTALAANLGRAVGEVRLAWTAPVDDGGGITTYAVSEATVSGGVTGSWSAVTSLRSTSTRATRMCGATYPAVCAYRVYAINGAGTSTASNTAEMAWATPSAATRLRAVPASLHDFTANDLTWGAPTRTGGLAVSYDLQVRVDSGAWTDVLTNTTATSVADDAHCTGGTSCLYRVRAHNAVGYGSASNSSALAVRPTGVLDLAAPVTAVDPSTAGATSGASTVTLSWTLPRAGLVDGPYQIQGCPDLCDATHGTWTSTIPVANTTTSLDVPCAAEARTCTYRVRATNTLGGVGAWMYRNVSPFAPRVVSAATGTIVDTLAVTFNGVAETGLGALADKHFVFWTCSTTCTDAANWSTDPGDDVSLGAIVGFPATVPVTCPGGTNCQIRVQFVDGLDHAGPLSVLAGGVGAAVPGAPESLAVDTGPTAGTVVATWSAPSELGTPALTQYQTRYSTDSATTFSPWSDTNSTATTRTITCGAGTVCIVEVRAMNAVGSGPVPEYESDVAADVPSQITGFTATLSADAILAWTLGPSYPAVTDVEYQLSTDGGTTWGSSWTSLSTTGSGATFAACSTTSDDTCTYRVRAVNSIGAGVASDPDGFTIP